MLVISYKNKLDGHCLVAPISTRSQTGMSEEWAHELRIDIGRKVSWVVCNHLYTVSTNRLIPPGVRRIPRLSEDEFQEVLSIIKDWLPALPS